MGVSQGWAQGSFVEAEALRNTSLASAQHQVWVRFTGIGVVGAVFTDTGF